MDSQIWLPRPIEEVFTFFSDAINLEILTPPFLDFRVLTAKPIEMKVGARIRYRLRLHGLAFEWESEITQWDPPYRFVDD